MKIGIITCHPDKLKYYFPTVAEPHLVPIEPYFTPDDQIAIDALRKRGHQVEPIIWGCALADIKVDCLIVRSPWDYMDSSQTQSAFLKWINDTAQRNIPLLNPAPFIHWMLDKHYLRDLEQLGVSTIPTQYIEKNSSISLNKIFLEKGSFIAKPCISAAGFGLYHITTLEEADQYQSEIEQKIKTDAYMIQDFIPEIKTKGEWSLIYFNGKYSHAIHKRPANHSILVHAERGGTLSFLEASEDIIQFGNKMHEALQPAFTLATRQKYDKTFILYLRIDIIETKNGPLLIECEGVEPELFFRARKGSEIDFCAAIEKAQV